MKKLNGKHLNSLLFYLHNDIQESVDWSFQSLRDNKLQKMISYSPNVELTTEEITTLIEILDNNPGIEDTLKKIMKNASMYPLFNLFNIIDGSGDIPDSNYEKVELIECNFEEVENIEDREDFLHDLFFSTYWDWIENKEQNNK